MTHDVYQAPSADLISEQDIERSPHFVVSNRKLWVMSVGTLGLYFYVWFYWHWRIAKEGDERIAHIWPLARCIFSIFFTHRLFARINRSVSNTDSVEPWSPSLNATVYVVMMVAGAVLEYVPAIAESSALSLLNVVLPVCIATAALSNAQNIANVVNSDPEGKANSNFSAANIVWLVLGVLLWSLFLFGSYMGV